MWLIKLPFRILALPVLLITGAISIFYKLFLNIGSFAIGLAYMALGLCIVSSIFLLHNWIYALVVVATGGVLFLGVMFAEVIGLGLEALNGKLAGFIFS